VSLEQTQISRRLPPQLAVVAAPSVYASKASSIFSAMTLPWDLVVAGETEMMLLR